MKRFFALMIVFVLCTAVIPSAFADVSEDAACSFVGQINSALSSYLPDAALFTSGSTLNDGVYMFTTDSDDPYFILAASENDDLFTGGAVQVSDIQNVQFGLNTALSFFVFQGYIDDISAMAAWIDENSTNFLACMEHNTETALTYVGDSNKTTLALYVFPTDAGAKMEISMNIYPDGVIDPAA